MTEPAGDDSHTAAMAGVCGAGGPFETVVELVRGVPMEVFARRHRSVPDLLAGVVAGDGAAGFVTSDGITLTRAQFGSLVDAVAGGLSSRHGVRPGDRVAILAANCVEWAATFFAVVHLGAVPCGFNGWWTAAEVRHGLELTAPVLLVGDAKRVDRLARADVGCPTLVFEHDWESSVAAGRSAPIHPANEDDPALILFTSGTTAAPRAALITHRGIVGFVDTHRANGAVRARLAGPPGASPGTPPGRAVNLMTSPMFHVSGLLAGVILGLVAGSRLVLRRGRFDPLDVLDTIQREGITNWSPLGNTGPRVIHHPAFNDYDVSSLRGLGFGGGPVSPATRAELQAAFPNVSVGVSTGYGSTETVATVAAISGDEYEANPTSVGRPLPTCQVEIRDEHDQLVPGGTPGRIVVRSPYRFLGYLGDPAATSAALLDGGFLDTGDIGFLDDGRLFVDSRARDLIIRSGENVSPLEVERRLDAHPAVIESAVVGRDHPEHGQEVVAVVTVTSEGAVSDAELAAFCAETLAAYKVPSSWELRTETLPRNAAGKVLKRELSP